MTPIAPRGLLPLISRPLKSLYAKREITRDNRKSVSDRFSRDQGIIGTSGHGHEGGGEGEGGRERRDGLAERVHRAGPAD